MAVDTDPPGNAKAVVRRGATGGEADVDVGTDSSPHDLGSNGDGDFKSGAKNAGGAEALSGKVKSKDSRTFSVKVDWLNDNDNVTITSSPPALTSVTDVEFNLIMRSDRFELRITDESGNAQNEIKGTANSH